MESLRIYVPANRIRQPVVKEALAWVVARGATLYHATGIWPGGNENGIASERVVVLEVLDCDAQRLDAVERLAAALLCAGEEVVLIARQETTTRFLIRSNQVPAAVQP